MKQLLLMTNDLMEIIYPYEYIQYSTYLQNICNDKTISIKIPISSNVLLKILDLLDIFHIKKINFSSFPFCYITNVENDLININQSILNYLNNLNEDELLIIISASDFLEIEFILFLISIKVALDVNKLL